MKRIDTQKAIAGAAKRIAGRPAPTFSAGPSAFVNGTPFNLFGVVMADAQKEKSDGRIVLPRKMNSKTNVEVLCLSLGVQVHELSPDLVEILEKLNEVSTFNDDAKDLLKNLANSLSTLIGRSPGRPKDSPAAAAEKAAAKAASKKVKAAPAQTNPAPAATSPNIVA